MFNIKLYYFLINYKKSYYSTSAYEEVDFAIYEKYLKKKKNKINKIGLLLLSEKHKLTSNDIMLLKASFKHKLPKHILRKIKYKYIIEIANNRVNEKLTLNSSIDESVKYRYKKINDVYSISKKHLYFFKKIFSPMSNSLYRFRVEILISDKKPSI